jgi:alginate O-acetyltransferase complex protein AlgI
MNVASLPFIGFGVLAACAYNLFRPLWWRQWILFIANVLFLATFARSLAAFVPFAAFLLLGYLGVRAMRKPETRWVFVASLIAVILAFVWLKKYTFLPSGSFLRFSYVTIGMSYILFRVLHLMIDAHADGLPANFGPLSYLNYTLNFMTLVSGPIQRYEDFAAAHLAPARPPLTIFMVGEGIHRVVVGFFKVTVLSWLLSMLQKSAIDALSQNPLLGSKVFTGAVKAVAYTLYLYFNFSGYTDLVIGVGRFFRFALPENFDRPFSADNFINFWSRWHITLSNWLKTYVFNPSLLASMRRVTSAALEPFLAVPALFITFFLVGIWHGQTSEFLFFGFLQGFGVAANQLYQILVEKRMGRERYRSLARNGVYVAVSRGLSFTWFTLTLVWFWSSWTQIREITAALGATGVVLSLLAVFLVSTLVLSALEAIRNAVLSIRWKGSPVFVSRYALTMIDTSLTVVSMVVVILLNAPPPDIVYKAF